MTSRRSPTRRSYRISELQRRLNKVYLGTFPLNLRQNCPYIDAKEIRLVDRIKTNTFIGYFFCSRLLYILLVYRNVIIVLLLLLNFKLQGQLKLCLYITHNYNYCFTIQASYSPSPWTFVEVYIIAQLRNVFQIKFVPLGSNYYTYVNANT